MATKKEIALAYDNWIDAKVDYLHEVALIVEEWRVDVENDEMVTAWVDTTEEFESDYEFRDEDEFFGFYDNDINSKLEDCYIFLECGEVYMYMSMKTALKLNKCIIEVE